VPSTQRRTAAFGSGGGIRSASRSSAERSWAMPWPVKPLTTTGSASAKLVPASSARARRNTGSASARSLRVTTSKP
jgi:hypothetical protein